MSNVVVVGSQWGDEGKGKIVDWLSEQADIVVRFQGGHNAGHTLVVGGTTYKLSLLPSGVVRPGKLSIIGNGVVIDPWAFLDEVSRLRSQGIKVEPDSDDPLRATLKGKLTIESRYGGLAEVSELKLVREKDNAPWKVAPAEVERTFKSRTKPK